jgi:hypothetical protein
MYGPAETMQYLLQKRFEREFEADMMKEAAATKRQFDSFTKWLEDFKRSEQ